MVGVSFRGGQEAGVRDQAEEPIGLIILGSMPFALLLTAVLLTV